jgi:hypothetical protein
MFMYYKHQQEERLRAEEARLNQLTAAAKRKVKQGAASDEAKSEAEVILYFDNTIHVLQYSIGAYCMLSANHAALTLCSIPHMQL